MVTGDKVVNEMKVVQYHMIQLDNVRNCVISKEKEIKSCVQGQMCHACAGFKVNELMTKNRTDNMKRQTVTAKDCTAAKGHTDLRQFAMMK